MAIKKEIWDKAKLLFEHGKPLSEIASTTGINKSTISKKSKSEKWEKFNEKSTLVLSEVDTIVKQLEINQQKSTLNPQELNLHELEVQSKLKTHRVAGNYQDMLLSKQDAGMDAIKIITNNTHKELEEAETNEDKRKILIIHFEHMEAIVDEDLIKKGVEANHKAGQTLGVVEQFAPKQDINVAQQQIQNTNIEEEIIITVKK